MQKQTVIGFGSSPFGEAALAASRKVWLAGLGATAVTRTAFNYFAEETVFRQSNILDNMGGTISGTLFDDWAGPIKAALSAEVTSLSTVAVLRVVAEGSVARLPLNVLLRVIPEKSGVGDRRTFRK